MKLHFVAWTNILPLNTAILTGAFSLHLGDLSSNCFVFPFWHKGEFSKEQLLLQGCLLFEMRSWRTSPNVPDVPGLS